MKGEYSVGSCDVMTITSLEMSKWPLLHFISNTRPMVITIYCKTKFFNVFLC